MGRLALNEEEHTVDGAWQWFEVQRGSCLLSRERTRHAIINGGNAPLPEFTGLSLDELEIAIQEQLDELSHLAGFSMLSATESALRRDYVMRVHAKDKTGLGRAYRSLFKEKKYRTRLDEDIIESWKNHTVEEKGVFSAYVGSLNYRDWIAHGRYWNPKFGRTYTPEVVYEICNAVLSVVRSAA
jgi:hypothetical protein